MNARGTRSPVLGRNGVIATSQPLASAAGLQGGYQAVMIDPATGVLMGGSDPRKDGVAIGW